MKAYLYLENGDVFEGKSFGYLEEVTGEVIFNTGMIGYQEILTDPSCWGQIVVMTYPLIGNYGINLEDDESEGIKVSGLIVRDNCSYPSNFRCEMELEDFLKQNKVPALEGVDTRALTKVLRNVGTMNGVISSKVLTKEEIDERVKQFSKKYAVSLVSTKEKYTIEGQGLHIALMDLGSKNNFIEIFKDRNCKITVLPYNTKADEILSDEYDCVFLSNGPGDPLDLTEVIDEIKKLIGKKPLLGVCLGHQILALALGGKTEKLKFGHRGGNHPVKDLAKDRVIITSQNHGYNVKEVPKDTDVTFINVNDNTIEGIRHKKYPICSVQFHPEANPGPKDAGYIIDEFIEYVLMNKEQ